MKKVDYTLKVKIDKDGKELVEEYNPHNINYDSLREVAIDATRRLRKQGLSVETTVKTGN